MSEKYLNLLKTTLDPITSRWDLYPIQEGEDAKSFSCLEDLLDRMLAEEIDRQCMVFAFGGGVVGDVAGFAAALLMRGIELIQIPTTLMSQVDSSVGGKNAINTRLGKNLVGSFLQPRIVLNDVSVLSSLPLDEMKSGYGEIIKYGVLRGKREFEWLEQNHSAIMNQKSEELVEVIRMLPVQRSPILDPFVNGAACSLLFLGPPASTPINSACVSMNSFQKPAAELPPPTQFINFSFFGIPPNSSLTCSINSLEI